MIIVNKGKAPAILIKKGLELTNKLKADFQNGQITFTFDKNVYGGKSVKEALCLYQNNKCCFCESSLHAQHGDVEHFRPKAGWVQENKDQLSDTGYYWLAYDWENLFLSCQKCNQTFKKNFFPLENPEERALDHTYDITKERHLIINPATDNPRDHLLFKKEIVTFKTSKGDETIKRTAIDLGIYEEDRRTILKYVESLVLLLKLLEVNQITSPDIQAVIASIKELVNPKKPYYAMLKDNFESELVLYEIVLS